MSTATALRVGVNLCWLTPGVVGGSEDLLVGWLRALAEHPAEGTGPVVGGRPLELTVFGPAALADAHPVLADAFRFVPAPVQGRARPLRVLVEASWLAARQQRLGLAVMHHAGGVLPFVHPGRNVLTVHDIQPLDLPENFARLKRRYLGLMLPRSVHAADVLVSASASVGERLVERLGADPARHRVVPPVLRAATAPSVAAIDAVRARHGLDRPWVLYPAVPYRHKNHRVLYEALARMLPRPPVQLVLTGGRGPLDDELAGLALESGVAESVRRLGRVPAEDYLALVAGALAVVFPSRYEGFGLGAFDALGVGTPVIAADIPPLAEMLGPGAVLVDPDDPVAWASAIAAVAADPQRRARMAAASLARAGFFGAERSASALAAAYRLAATATPARRHRSRLLPERRT